MTVEIDGHHLTLDQFIAVARGGDEVRVTRWDDLEETRQWLEEHVDAWRQGDGSEPIYGVTTGFGPLKNARLEPDDVEQVQRNLLRSHAVGVAVAPEDYFEEEIVRGIGLLRANTFLRGRSAVRREVVELIVAMLNARVHPLVPRRGSVGASGDLCPLAHFALVLLGEGEATLADGSRVAGDEALLRNGLSSWEPSFKEGLALINGTAVSTACLALALHDAEVLAGSADIACALSLEALGGHGRALDEKVHAERRQAGQQDAAAALRSLTEGSQRVSATDDRQDPYSLRCAPQVHGASRDALSFVRLVVDRELGAVTDNPLFFALAGDSEPWDLSRFGENARRFERSPDGSPVYSAGNFHGQPVAVAADLLAVAAAELASISERRTAALLDPSFSRGLPPNLACRPGLESGLMLLQYASASLVSENKGLCHPASVDSIPTGSGSEDHVPMSTWAARKARTVVALATRVLATELLVAAQANDWRAVLPDPSHRGAAELTESTVREFVSTPTARVASELGEGSRAAYLHVREISERCVDDRSLADDGRRLARALGEGRLLEAAGPRARPVRRLRFED